jgi:asparagine synthetase B (glutamine-hydrolysing)
VAVHDDSWYEEVWDHPANASRLTRLELITGWALGPDRRAPDITEAEPVDGPVRALEQALRPALTTSPCFVAFSGGRDSSVLLALATRVARRERLDDPVPLTVRFPRAPESEEADWQNGVVRHLGLNDWKVVSGSEDIDLVGCEWQRSLRDHGLQWPPSAHGLLPLQRAARGGALIHGEGGDQVLGGWGRAGIGDLLTRRRRVLARDWRLLARGLSPAPVRREIERRLATVPAPWLSAPALAAWRRFQAAAYAGEPRTWPAYLRWTRQERATLLMLETLERQSARVGCAFYAPFWNASFLRSLGRWGGLFGRGDRGALMTALFSDLLPSDLLRRSTKAHFTRAFFGEPTRSFARTWQGPVPEPAVVAREPLRAAWLSDLPPNTSAVLLQASWLLATSR